jgi:16S rRNA processing protein RimM
MWSIPISELTTLRVGRLLKVHGLKGAFKLELYTDTPEQRFAPGSELELQVPPESPWHGKTVTVRELRWHNQVPFLLLEGIETRSQAETLVRAILLIRKPLDELPAEPEAWYDHQLTGLKVIRDGVQIGTVKRVEHLPAQDILVIATADREVLLPFVSAFVPEVRVATSELVVQPPGGLFEETSDAN